MENVAKRGRYWKKKKTKFEVGCRAKDDSELGNESTGSKSSVSDLFSGLSR